MEASFCYVCNSRDLSPRVVLLVLNPRTWNALTLNHPVNLRIDCDDHRNLTSLRERNHLNAFVHTSTDHGDRDVVAARIPVVILDIEAAEYVVIVNRRTVPSRIPHLLNRSQTLTLSPCCSCCSTNANSEVQRTTSGTNLSPLLYQIGARRKTMKKPRKTMVLIVKITLFKH